MYGECYDAPFQCHCYHGYEGYFCDTPICHEECLNVSWNKKYISMWHNELKNGKKSILAGQCTVWCLTQRLKSTFFEIHEGAKGVK